MCRFLYKGCATTVASVSPAYSNVEMSASKVKFGLQGASLSIIVVNLEKRLLFCSHLWEHCILHATPFAASPW
jgi:hypothetical protein